MRFYRDVVIANWKLYPIPLSLCLKYNTLRNFWGLIKKPIKKYRTCFQKLNIRVILELNRPQDLSHKSGKSPPPSHAAPYKIPYFSTQSYWTVILCSFYVLKRGRGLHRPPSKSLNCVNTPITSQYTETSISYRPARYGGWDLGKGKCLSEVGFEPTPTEVDCDLNAAP